MRFAREKPVRNPCAVITYKLCGSKKECHYLAPELNALITIRNEERDSIDLGTAFLGHVIAL